MSSWDKAEFVCDKFSGCGAGQDCGSTELVGCVDREVQLFALGQLLQVRLLEFSEMSTSVSILLLLALHGLPKHTH